MSQAGGDGQGRRLRAVEAGAAPDRAALEAAITASVGATAEGVVTRSLATLVADHLDVAPLAISPRDLSSALGLLIASGRVDEVGGRLVAVSQEQRQAG